MYKNYNITLDVTEDSRSPLLYVNTNDLNTFKLNIIITQHGKPVDLSNASVRIAVLKPDKTTVFQDCEVVDSVNGKVEVVLDNQAYIVSGRHLAEIMIYDGSDKVAVTGKFEYEARQGILNDGTVESSNKWPAIEEAISNVEGILTDLRENGTGIDAEAREGLESVRQDVSGINRRIENDKTEYEIRFNEIDGRLNPLEQDVPASDSREAFIQAMNEKAEEIGMIDTNFTNPHGLSNENQVTTAKDMLLMGINALAYKEITESWSKRKHTVDVKGDNAREIEIETTVQDSSMNDEYNVLGGKTGTLSALGVQNLLSVVNTKYTNNWFIGCVLDASPSRYTASRQLYDIAMTSLKNQVPIKQHVSNLSNGNFDEGLKNWSVYAGNPTLTKDDYYSFPQSLRVNSTGTSSQVRRTLNLIQGNKYYISAMVKCTRHSSGTLGVQFTGTSPSTTIGLSRTTNGWERVSGIVEAEGSSAYLYAGGISSANLDGYVDSVNVINLTAVYGAGKEPSKSQMDKYYWRDIASNTAIVCQVPVAPLSFNRDNLPVLFEKNSEVTTYPASLTKVMTAIVMLDNVFDLNKTVEIIDSDIAGGSGPTFQAGDIITLKDALHCLMLPSSNTIANAVARVVGKKVFLENRAG